MLILWNHFNTLGPIDAYMYQQSTIIDSDNGLSPGRRQAIIWANAGILLMEHVGTSFSEIFIQFKHFHPGKCIWKCHLQNGSHFVSASMC